VSGKTPPRRSYSIAGQKGVSMAGHAGHVLPIARYLGSLDKNGKEIFSIGLPCPVVIAAMVELAEQRDGKVYYDLEELQASRGIIRFMQSVPLLPDWCRFCVNLPTPNDFHLAIEPPLTRSTRSTSAQMRLARLPRRWSVRLWRVGIMWS
jgi:hypothetical protein